MPDDPAGCDADQAFVESGIGKCGLNFAHKRTGKSAFEKAEREIDEVAFAKRFNYRIANVRP